MYLSCLKMTNKILAILLVMEKFNFHVKQTNKLSSQKKATNFKAGFMSS